jgi:transcriptional regulator GlxA family with amidase domain
MEEATTTGYGRRIESNRVAAGHFIKENGMPAPSTQVASVGSGVEKAPSSKELVKPAVISPESLLLRVRERRLRRVLERIVSGPLRSVRELAGEVRLSPAHLQRLFKHETGVHISDLLAESKLRNAARLLSTTDMEIKEIAYLTGYQHHSSFVRAFQRRFHQSPKEYRQPSAAA